jgi:exopolyphosphatase/guanosine-5'-triphosphate,3'-diphosphate pyrophosphatase
MVKLKLLLILLTLTTISQASSLTFDFSNPAFSGEGYSSHVLSISQLEYNRKESVKDDLLSAEAKAARDAKNRNLFIDGVRDILNVQVEVIPGEEEAALSFIGATYQLDQGSGPFLVVDIGGGSTEFVFGNESVDSAKSVNIGCVRMSERHLIDQPPSMAQISQAIIDIDIAIAQAAVIVPISEAKTLVAVAGTATTVAAAALKLEQYDRYLIHLSRISATSVHQVAGMFQSMDKDQIASLGYMHPGRVDVITAGALVLSRIMAATGASEFIASESDILDGIAWSLTK